MTVEEFIFKLTKVQRTAIIAGVAVLFLVAFYFLVVSDLLDEIAKVRKQIGQVKIEIINQEKILAEGPTLKEKINNLKRELETKVASLPEKQEIEDLLKKITDLLSEYNLIAGRFVPGKEEINRELFYAKIPITLSVRGDYQRQGAFLASLQDLPRIVNVPRITLRRSGQMSGREGELAKKLDVIPLDGEINGETYRRLSPEEIKAITTPPPPKGKPAPPRPPAAKK